MTLRFLPRSLLTLSPATRRSCPYRRQMMRLEVWHRSFWAPPPSSTVENSGSIARDILATERTFLAWARTGLGFVGAGSALFAAYHRQQPTESTNNNNNASSPLLYSVVPACALLMANGAFLLVFATRRYLTVVAALQRSQFPVDIRGTLTAVVLTAASTILSLGLIASSEVQQTKRQDIRKDE